MFFHILLLTDIGRRAGGRRGGEERGRGGVGAQKGVRKGGRQRAAVGGWGGERGASELTSSQHTCPLSPALCTGVFVRTVKHAIEEAWQEQY